jgi:GNAT superfamily N-acetyltransferase
VIAFSLRAWAPIFDSIRDVLPDEIFFRLHPDWRADQAEAVRSSCLSEERDVFVAVADGRPVGFVAVALNAFHEGLGVIDIVGVDPDYQRRRIGSRLTGAAIDHMRREGMDIPVVETGGDPGHAPCSGSVRRGGIHASADQPVLPTPRLTFVGRRPNAAQGGLLRQTTGGEPTRIRLPLGSMTTS